VLGRVLDLAQAEKRERPPKGFGRGWVAMDGAIEGPEAKGNQRSAKKRYSARPGSPSCGRSHTAMSHFVVFST
jgi:hypothetical protein